MTELNTWLKVRSWKPVDQDALDDDSILEWVSEKDYIKLTEPIFDERGKLKNYSDEEWKDDWLKRLPIPATKEDEDDIPF